MRSALHRSSTQHAPVIVPCTTEPFLSSIVTVSLFSFIKNLGGKRDIRIGITDRVYKVNGASCTKKTAVLRGNL